VVGLDPVLRAVDLALQLRIAEIAQGVDAADQLVELKAENPPGSAIAPSLRIRVAYASGVTMNLHGRFSDAAAAEQYLSRFYPDLLGKSASSTG